MTLEHIWPQSLGGATAPPIFQTRDVCGKCNSTCGLFVDGAFLKSWFISAERGSSAHNFLDPLIPGPAPFWYMGIDTEFPAEEGYVCERWLGLAGEHVYHVHQKDQDRWTPYAGGDVIRRNVDPGRVYIFLTSPTEYWSLTALLSLIQQFPKATRRCMTRVDGLPRMPIAMPADPPSSEAEAREATWIDGRTEGVWHPHKVAIQVDFSDRFLAKVSLGLGHTIFGDKVSSSPYADELRKMLWSKNSSQREDIALRGSGFWTGPALAEVPDILKWAGAWSIFLTSVGQGFGMALTTPGGHFMSMMISDDPSLWPSNADRMLLNGAVFIFVPQRARVIGPIPISEFIAHRSGSRRRSDLTELENMRSTLAPLPPKNTSGHAPHASSE
jgi:HNH endonuclease